MLALFTTYVNAVVAKVRNDEGAAAVEYGLLVGLIAVAIIATVTLMGTTLSGLFGYVQTQLVGLFPAP